MGGTETLEWFDNHRSLPLYTRKKHPPSSPVQEEFMRKWSLICVVSAGLALLPGLSRSQAIPTYDQYADFLMVPQGPAGNGLLGYVNPAMSGTLHGPDLRFFMSDRSYSRWNFLHWGLFAGMPHLSFGMVRQRLQAPLPGGDAHHRDVTDYRISFSAGSPAFSLGAGYGWSGGQGREIPRDALFSLGALIRPSRYVSAGLSSRFARHGSSRECLVDLALRPMGTGTAAVFGEAALTDRDRLQSARWSLGASIRPFTGVYICGKWSSSRTFALGIHISLGREGLFFQSGANKKSGGPRHTMGFRIGTPTPNLRDAKLRRNTRALSLEISGIPPYQTYRLFDSRRQTLFSLLRALEEAVEDPRVAGVAVHLTGFRGSGVLLWEIREGLKKVQNAGKSVVLFLERAMLSAYHLSSVADRIVLDPQGMILLEGVSIHRTYLAGTLEKLGIGFDAWRFFPYKSVLETYSRKSMSPPDREQLQALVDDYYDLMRKEICQSRSFTYARFDSLVNRQTLFPAREALHSGLVDTLGRWKDRDRILESMWNLKIRGLTSGKLTGRIFPPEIWGAPPKIAIVYVRGVCDMNDGIAARRMEKQILGLADDPKIRAVILRVDSPGGDALASDLVAGAVRQCSEEKPVIVSQGRVAASGGYRISMEGDCIVSAPNTLTGSIGIIGGWIWDQGIGTGLGMSADHVRRGEHADLAGGLTFPLLGLPLPQRNLTPEERSRVESAFRDMYNQFVAEVASSRNMDYREVKKIAGGRIWTGRAAQKLGLIDLLGGLDRALAVAKEKAGIAPATRVEWVELPPRQWLNPSVLNPLSEIRYGSAESPAWVWEYVKLVTRYPAQPLLMAPPDLLPVW
jgi:protease-4